MSRLPKELVLEFVRGGNLKLTKDIKNILKDIFRDTIQGGH